MRGHGIEPRNLHDRDADAVKPSGRQHGRHRFREVVSGPARSKTRCTCRTFLRENREVPWLLDVDGTAGRIGKTRGRTPMTHDHGKSDGSVVAAKHSNKATGVAAEGVEPRRPTEGNTSQQNTPRTQSRNHGVPSELERVREVARKDKDAKFTALLHHITVDRLRSAFRALRRSAAAGVDGVTWEQYSEGLEDNLRDLHGRLHRGGYRAKPSRRVFIAKPDGTQRPLGIASLEDKVVQRAVVEVLNAIYEVDFLGFSYGFRPGRSQHMALDALATGIRRKKVNWVLDADIRGFFDAIDHGWLRQMLEHRIADRRLLRLIYKWLNAGVIEDGVKTWTTTGSPQGATISPLLANIFLHYVFDLWVAQWRRQHARGEMIVVRYADDTVLGFQYEDDARRFWAELGSRMSKFGLELHPIKTRLLRFGTLASLQCRERGERKPGTFDFLGFTHACGKTRGGRFKLVRLTSRKRMAARVRAIRVALHRGRHRPVPVQGAWLRRVVTGYFAYHAIPTNGHRLQVFRDEVTKAWLHALRRRSQRHRMPWSRMHSLAERWIPRPRILHPWPDERFDARTRGRSPVR
jgi:group II intron reverse transcriptase/maturase